MIDILAGIATITLFASSHFCADEQIEETQAINNSSEEEEGTADVIAASTSSSCNSGDQDDCTTPTISTSANELANESISTLPSNNKLNNSTMTSTTLPSKPTNENIIQHNGAEYVITTEYQEDEEETQFTNNFRIPTICSTEIIGDTVYGLVRYVTESCSNTASSTCES